MDTATRTHTHNGHCGDLHKFEGEAWADEALLNTTDKRADAKAYLQRWADMEVMDVTENEDGSVDLFLVSLLGSGYRVHIDAEQVG